jgi:hypothetical protein
VFVNQRGLITSALANLVVFVAAPSLFYFAAVNVTASSSILSDAAASPLRPFVAAYGTPAYWTSSCFDQCKPTLKQSSSRPWPWNRYYRLTSRITGGDWLRDIGPWIALSLLLACASTLKATNRSQSVSLGSYFLQPAQEGRDKSLAARTPIGPWRARVLAALVVVVGLPLVAAILMVYLVAYLTYIMVAAIVMAAVLAWVWRSYVRPRNR